jgi:hypothetical protein
MLDKAKTFTVLMAGGAKELAPFCGAFAEAINSGCGGTNGERWALTAKAWTLYSQGQPITAEDLELEYCDNRHGIKRLNECPTVGGIDIGDPRTYEEDHPSAKDPTPEEITEKKATIRKTHSKPKPAPTTTVGSRKGQSWKSGDTAWVQDSDGEHYFGELAEDPVTCDDGSNMVTVHSHDGDWEVHTEDLCLHYPGSQEPAAPQLKARKPKGLVPWEAGALAWVQQDGQEPWQGRVISVLGTQATITVAQGFQGAGSKATVPLALLHHQQPAVA